MKKGLFLSLLFLASCAKSSSSTQIEQGKKLVRKLGCYACHSIHGRGGSNGPDLSQVGRKYIRLKGSKQAAKEWFIRHLEDPKRYPGQGNKRYFAKMPSYLHTTTKKEREAIAEYLLSLGSER